MIVFPAIDLRKGRCVRLRQGDPGAETVYDDDPVAVALRWQEAGARWLHVVNLDGAFAGGLGKGANGRDLPVNLAVLRDMAHVVDISIQFGGGLRSLEDMQRVLDLGADRVVLGTVAARQPALVFEAVKRFGAQRVLAGIDARDGAVATQGWQQASAMDPVALGQTMRRRGICTAIYTDISRDGMLSGVNVPATAALAQKCGLRVIASGGVRSLQDICALKQVEAQGVTGVVIGRALYTGQIDLAQAVAAAV